MEAGDVTAWATSPDPQLGITMDLSILLRTAHDQAVTVVTSYRVLPPVHDYLVIADEMTLVHAHDELRDHQRVLVPAADHGTYDTSVLDRQNLDFFASILSGSEPVSNAPSVRPVMAALQAAQDVLDRQDARPRSE